MKQDPIAVARECLKALGPTGWGRSELSDADVEALLRLAPVEQVAPGEALVREGEPAERAYFVLAGRLRASIALPGEDRVLNEIPAGEVTGETALFLTGGRRSATLTALEPTTVLVLGREVFLPGAPNPAIVALESHILQGLARRIDKMGTQIVDAWRAASGGAPTKAGILHLLGGAS